MSEIHKIQKTHDLRRRDLLAGAAAFAGFAGVGLLPGTAAAAARQRPGALRGPSLSTGDKAVVARVDARRALRHLRVLSDDIGWRVAGTRQEHRSAHYIARTLRDLGYKVELQPFTVPDKNLAELRAGREDWQSAAAANGALGRARGEVVDLGPATEVTADLSGRIALFTRVAGKELDQAKAAVAKGARAVLISNVRSPTYPERKAASFFPVLAEAVPVPVLGVAEYHGERIRAGARRLSLEVTAHKGLTSYNVLSERRATLPNPGGKAVIVSGHYDSVPGSPGGNDDGSGTVLCLELARALRRLPTQQDLRFCFWGAEELGLVGARHYVKQLDDAAAARITGCFQNDMVATSHPPAGTYWLLSVDGKENTTTTAIAAAAERLGYTGQTKGPVARGSSDHEAFFERGIAAGNFSWRGGEAPSQLEPVYHTPEDTVDGNVSLKRLQVSLELIGCAAYEVARHR
ncbi:M20/M25/M40 family metallo-hydrolase [Actinomadura rubrisoli]|uniref:M20/M25/M40 family metallo-hydrolase n=1 Tax=Actinomadura rubrisoli TaxID=2530368 RepID=A0A4R5BMQ6_9ACTN|nr:M20/M25/M40 family metallo-hydrolase [Actinomadura rubrisoli]TDD85222.1 M20/M25/M40 family metallo-hydrolase [Actinomadura rubrisoli]